VAANDIKKETGCYTDLFVDSRELVNFWNLFLRQRLPHRISLSVLIRDSRQRTRSPLGRQGPVFAGVVTAATAAMVNWAAAVSSVFCQA